MAAALRGAVDECGILPREAGSKLDVLSDAKCVDDDFADSEALVILCLWRNNHAYLFDERCKEIYIYFKV